MIAPITQFLRPDGRMVQATCEVANDLKSQLDAIDTVGTRLTAEVLTTGEVSFTIEHPDYGDFDGCIVLNGPDVPRAIDELIRRFNRSVFEKWLVGKMPTKQQTMTCFGCGVKINDPMKRGDTCPSCGMSPLPSRAYPRDHVNYPTTSSKRRPTELETLLQQRDRRKKRRTKL